MIYSTGWTVSEEYRLIVDSNIYPVVHPARQILEAVQAKVKKELERMEQLGVIERVQHPTH